MNDVPPPPAPNTVGRNYIIAVAITAIFGLLGDAIPFISNLIPRTETPEYPSSGFKQWERYKPDVIHRAKSDGFVAAYGHSPAGTTAAGVPRTGTGLIKEGASAAAMATVTRFGAGYQGAVLPVAKGRYWTVKHNPNSGRVMVHWLAVGAETEGGGP